MNHKPDEDFYKRRDAARIALNAKDNEEMQGEPKREAFFNHVYDNANGDAAGVPWADLAPKAPLVKWLDAHPGSGKRAVDVACGLGDNAEALAAAGYQTTGFDLAKTAIDWAKKRFPDGPVTYQQGDLFDLPEGWVGGFDVVSEIYTIQSVPVEMHQKIATAVASLVAPGGSLLLIARTREEGSEASGPPWHLTPSELAIFAELGFERVEEEAYRVTRGERPVPHVWAEWKRTA